MLELWLTQQEKLGVLTPVQLCLWSHLVELLHAEWTMAVWKIRGIGSNDGESSRHYCVRMQEGQTLGDDCLLSCFICVQQCK